MNLQKRNHMVLTCIQLSKTWELRTWKLWSDLFLSGRHSGLRKWKLKLSGYAHFELRAKLGCPNTVSGIRSISDHVWRRLRFNAHVKTLSFPSFIERTYTQKRVCYTQKHKKPFECITLVFECTGMHVRTAQNDSKQSKLIHDAFLTTKWILLLHNELYLFRCHTVMAHWCQYSVTLLSLSPLHGTPKCILVVSWLIRKERC